jgi:putative drug exporter of the RND superfamily
VSGGQFFGRLASAAQRWAVWCVGLWVLVAVALTVVAPSLEEVGVQDDADFLPADAPSQQADRLLRKLFPDDPERDAAIIVVARDGGLRPADHDWLRRWAQEVEQFDGVTEVRSVAGNPAMAQLLRSPDGAAELAIVDLEVAPFTTRGCDLVW